MEQGSHTVTRLVALAWLSQKDSGLEWQCSGECLPSTLQILSRFSGSTPSTKRTRREGGQRRGMNEWMSKTTQGRWWSDFTFVIISFTFAQNIKCWHTYLFLPLSHLPLLSLLICINVIKFHSTLPCSPGWKPLIVTAFLSYLWSEVLSKSSLQGGSSLWCCIYS